MNLGDLARLVESMLSERTRALGNYHFTVAQGLSFQDEENLWHLYVNVDRPVPQRGQYYDILNDIEELLESQHKLNVMLVPVKPENASQAS